MAPFAYINNASIRHLKVTGNIEGGIPTAGVVGYANTSDGGANYIEDCHVSASIQGKRQDNQVIAGGILGHGQSSNTTINGCLFDGKISTNYSVNDSWAAAIVAWCDDATNIH